MKKRNTKFQLECTKTHKGEKHHCYGKKIPRDIVEKAAEKRKGKNNPKAKSIINLTTMEIFDTVTEASKKTGAAISCIVKCCKGTQDLANGLEFMYYEDYLLYGVKNPIKISSGTPIINLDTNEIFISIKSATLYYNVRSNTISMCCSGKYKTAGGYRWAYFGKETLRRDYDKLNIVKMAEVSV